MPDPKKQQQTHDPEPEATPSGISSEEIPGKKRRPSQAGTNEDHVMDDDELPRATEAMHQNPCGHCGLHPPRLQKPLVEWNEFKDDINHALKRQIQTQRNRLVKALLIDWEDNKSEEKKGNKRCLESVFREKYGIESENWGIPSENPTRALKRKIKEFRDARDGNGRRYNRKGNLLIFYYTGHGSVRDGIDCILASGAGGERVNWNRIQEHHIETLKADALVILACCYAGRAAQFFSVGCMELLTAGGKETTVLGSPRDGFTTFSRALIKSLKIQAAPFTISELYAYLVTSQTHFLRESPVHTSLGLGQRRIWLRPLESNVQRASVNGRALIHVHFSGELNRFDLEQWLSTALPDEIAKVEIGAAYISQSTILVLSIPMDLWNFLPDHPAYSFIGIVKSDNLLLKSMNDDEEAFKEKMLRAEESEKEVKKERDCDKKENEKSQPKEEVINGNVVAEAAYENEQRTLLKDVIDKLDGAVQLLQQFRISSQSGSQSPSCPAAFSDCPPRYLSKQKKKTWSFEKRMI